MVVVFTTTSTPPRWAGGANALASTGYACRNPDQLMIWFAAVGSLKPRATGLGRLIRAPPE
jgi:hypothetical protein